MKDEIFIKNSVQKLRVGKATFFLDPKEQKLIEQHFKTSERTYQCFSLYEDCDKVIFYTNDMPDITLLKITSHHPLEHRSILGSLFAIGIDSHMFGDIIVGENSYVVVLSQIANLIQYQLDQIGREKVHIEPVDLNILNGYQRKYHYLELKVPSLRSDAIIAKALSMSRSKVLEKINNKEIYLNYENLKNGSKILKEQDVFSVRKYGKYRFHKILGKTKKNDYRIELWKYE